MRFSQGKVFRAADMREREGTIPRARRQSWCHRDGGAEHHRVTGRAARADEVRGTWLCRAGGQCVQRARRTPRGAAESGAFAGGSVAEQAREPSFIRLPVLMRPEPSARGATRRLSPGPTFSVMTR